MKNSLKSYTLNLLLILGLTVLALWFALKDNYQEVLTLIGSIKWYWLVMILSWGMLYSCVAGKVLSIFAKKNKKDYTTWQGIQNGLVGSFFSGITPSATGGQFAQAYIFKKQGIKVSDGASVLWADFIVYQTTMMVYVTILFFARYTHYMEIMGGPLLFLILVGYVINVFVICVLWTMALLPKMYVKLSNLFVKILAKLKIVKNKEKTLISWSTKVTAFTDEIKKLKNERKLIVQSVLWNIIRMTIQFMLPWFIANAVGCEIGLDKFIDCLALSSFVLMANAFIPIPGASGGTEFVFTQLFYNLLSNGAYASSIMILWRFSTFHLVMLVGAFMFIYLKQKYNRNATSYQSDDEMMNEEVLP